MKRYRPLVFTIILYVVLCVLNPYIMDSVSELNSDTYTKQLTDVNQYEVKRANRIPGLVYLGETIVLVGLLAYSVKRVLK